MMLKKILLVPRSILVFLQAIHFPEALNFQNFKIFRKWVACRKTKIDRGTKRKFLSIIFRCKNRILSTFWRYHLPDSLLTWHNALTQCFTFPKRNRWKCVTWWNSLIEVGAVTKIDPFCEEITFFDQLCWKKYSDLFWSFYFTDFCSKSNLLLNTL